MELIDILRENREFRMQVMWMVFWIIVFEVAVLLFMQTQNRINDRLRWSQENLSSRISWNTRAIESLAYDLEQVKPSAQTVAEVLKEYVQK